MVVTACGNPTHLPSFYLCAALYKRGKQCPALTAVDRQPATLKRKTLFLGTPTEMLASGDSFSKGRKVFISVANENEASGCAVDLRTHSYVYPRWSILMTFNEVKLSDSPTSQQLARSWTPKPTWTEGGLLVSCIPEPNWLTSPIKPTPLHVVSTPVGTSVVAQMQGSWGHFFVEQSRA